MGGWQDPKAPGPYAYMDINGSRHNITRTLPLLGSEQPHSLLLEGYFDVGWSGKHSKHSVKTLTKRHAELICDRTSSPGAPTSPSPSTSPTSLGKLRDDTERRRVTGSDRADLAHASRLFQQLT